MTLVKFKNLLVRSCYSKGFTATNIMLISIFVVFALQHITVSYFGRSMHANIFILQSNNFHEVWSWFMAVFSHRLHQLDHLGRNAISLVLLGSIISELTRRERFISVYLTTGVFSLVSFVVYISIFNLPISGVIGASGALFGIMGYLTTYKIKFVIHNKISIPFRLLASIFILEAIVGASSRHTEVFTYEVGTAHVAHIVGFIIGLIFAYVFQEKNKNKNMIIGLI